MEVLKHMTTTARVSKLPECDLCKDSNIFTPPEEAQYDGRTRSGIWAFMCARHFQTNGTGLGLGRGQRLITKSEYTQHENKKADQLCAKCGKGCPSNSLNKEEIRHRVIDQPQKIELMIELGLYCEEVVNF